MAELEFLGVSKVFPGGVKAADRLDLLVQDGELLVLVGPSGSGKTTTLRLLAGLEQPTSGKIRIGERDVTGLSPQARDLAMVFQQLGLYGHLTAHENMAFSLRLRQKGKWFPPGSGERLSADEIDQRVRKAAALLEIEELLGRKPAELSGGEQQRVALGRAIVRRPQALLLDEPLASLDVPTRLSLRRELKRLHGELKLTTIHVTHDQADAMALGDRIAVLNAGRIEQVATPAEIYRRPATRFVAGFFGSQGMNFATGEWEDQRGQRPIVHHSVLPVAAEDWPGDTLIDGEVTIGFRPEDGLLLTEVRPGQLAWEIKVVAVEYFGEHSYATVSPATESRQTWIVRIGNHERLTVGDQRLLAIRSEGLHWFSDDGRRFA
jgi:ABC-type sugar transport system ATPase subunit